MPESPQDSYFSPTANGSWYQRHVLNPRIETEIGFLISSAQQAKRNAENFGRSEFVRWRNVHRWCGKQIARILSENAEVLEPPTL